MNSTLYTLIRYLLLSICLIMGLFLLFVFRTAYSQMFVPLAASGWTGSAWASTLDKVLFIGGGLGFIVLMGVADHYLRKADTHRLLWGRFARFFGIEVMILLALHTVITITSEVSAMGLVILMTELFIGMTATGFSFQVLPPGTSTFSQRLHQMLKKL